MNQVKTDSQYGDVEIATLVNDGKTFNYAVNYPVFKNKKMDAALKRFAEKEVRQFQKETKDADQEHTKSAMNSTSITKSFITPSRQRQWSLLNINT